MTAPTKNYTAIPAADVAANKAITTTLGVQLADNDEHLKQVLYQGYTPAQAHDHDGVNSAYVKAIGCYDFTDSGNTAIGTNTLVSASQNLAIPTNGLIMMIPSWQFFTGASGSAAHIEWGLQVNSVNHYPSYVDAGSARVNRMAVDANETDRVRGAVQDYAQIGVTVLDAMLQFSAAVLDVADLGMATGLQAVQPVLTKTSGTASLTLNGAAVTARIKVIIFAG